MDNSSEHNKVDDFIEHLQRLKLTPTDPQFFETMDQHIYDAKLSVSDKAAAIKQLLPQHGDISTITQYQVTSLIKSIPPQALSQFKLELDYDGDYHDTTDLVYHDIEQPALRNQILSHLSQAPAAGTKVLISTDNALYARSQDARYPDRTLYPGANAFIRSLQQEPEPLSGTAVTALTSQPGRLDRSGTCHLMLNSEGQLAFDTPSGKTHPYASHDSDSYLDRSGAREQQPEATQGQAKYQHFKQYAKIHPEYHYVFIGNHTEADQHTAQLMADSSSHSNQRMTCCLQHNSEASGQQSPNSFRNYIEAAGMIWQQQDPEQPLLQADDVRHITQSALKEFQLIEFDPQQHDQSTLWEQYQQDARQVADNLQPTHPEQAAAIREQLEHPLQHALQQKLQQLDEPGQQAVHKLADWMRERGDSDKAIHQAQEIMIQQMIQERQTEAAPQQTDLQQPAR